MNHTPATRDDVTNANIQSMSAVIAVVRALSRQPGFDHAQFGLHLREEVERLNNTPYGASIAQHTLAELIRELEAQ